jgi:rubrerythrin
MERDMMAAIKNLIMLDVAAVDAYQVASDACTRQELKAQFGAFKSDHERHVRELSEWVSSHGEEAPAGETETGLVIKRYTELSSQEDRGAVLAMRGNEELTNNAYCSALGGDLGLPDDLRALIEANFEDERRHIAWIRETIAVNGWDKEPEELREVVRHAA